MCPDATWEADQATGKCYFFSDNAVVYDVAKEACQNSKLLIILNIDDQSFVSSKCFPVELVQLFYFV